MTATGPDRRLNDEQACAALGISKRTLDRKVAAQQLHPTARPVPGRTHPERVFDPDEIRAHQRPTPAIVMRKEPPPTAPETTPKAATSVPPMAQLTRFNAADIAALVPVIDMVIERRQRAEKPLTPWVSLKDASKELGITHKLLRRVVDAGGVRAIRDQAIKINREDFGDINFACAEVEAKNAPRRKRQ